MLGISFRARRPGRSLLTVALAAGLLLSAVPARAQEACETFDDVRGANPAPAAVWAEIDAAARGAGVPATLLAAVAFAEGYDDATARNWVQFRADGRPIVSFDCGIGMLQLTAADGYDPRRLAADWRYNVRAGAAVLRAKWDASQANAPAGLERDEGFAENWWAALYRYNGQGTAAAAYADGVMAFATDPIGEAAVFTSPLRTLRTPSQVFPAFTPSHWYVVRDGEAILADSDGTVVERRADFVPTTLSTRPTPLPLPPAPRLGGATRDAIGIAIQVSRAVFPDAGGDTGAGAPQARHAVLARDDTWADSLAGTALSGDWGPILYARGGPAGTLPDETLAELRRVLGPGGRVYLLGGVSALSPAVESAVTAAGFSPKRLSGQERLRTALAIATEVRALQPASGRVLVARAYDTPVDALASGAAAGHHHVPLVLSPTPGLTHQFLRDGIRGLGVPAASLVGGTSALSEQVAADLRALGLGVERVSGPTRWHTATALAARFFPQPRTSFVAVDLDSEPGWAWALPAGALSAMLDAPQVGVAPGYLPPPTAEAIRAAGGTEAAPVRVVLVGDAERAGTAVRVAVREAATGG